MITIENLQFSQNSGFSLFIDRLVIRKGEIFSIIGPNGAGKTTLLNIIALFQKHSKGSINIFGQNILTVKDELSYRRRISFVFSRPYLLNSLSVYENVSLPLRFRGQMNAQKVKEALELFKIEHFSRRKVSELSQGEMHRVSMARAFITQPELILLDEAFLSLDYLYKQMLILELRKIIKQTNTTAMFVTQEQNEAMQIADTMAVMKEGRILQRGNVEEIFTKPNSKDVADFVGVKTVIEGTVIEKKENLCLVKIHNEVIKVVSECEKGDSVFLCLRPENITLLKNTENSSARNRIKTRIDGIESFGLGYKVNLFCGFNLIALITKEALEELKLKVKDDVFAVFKATSAHLIKR